MKAGAPEDMLAAGLRRMRDRDFKIVTRPPPPERWTRRTARLAGLVLPFDGHGVGRDLTGAAWRGGFAGVRRVAGSLTRRPDTFTTILSRKYRCAWIRIPKAASESIMAAMLGADPDCEVFDTRYAEFYEVRPEAREWFTFGFVRHPFDRALSFWSEIHFAHERYTDRAHVQRRRRDWFFETCYGLAETRDFDAYCRWLRTPYGADRCGNAHIVSYNVWIRAVAAGRGRPPDFIGRVENLDADWSQAAARAGIPVPKPPLVHSAVGWDAAPEEVEKARTARAGLLSKYNKALLAVRYADDLELGGYSPTGLDTVGPLRLRDGGAGGGACA